MRQRTVLGLGGSDHDVHACIRVGDTVQIMIEDERISRKKYGLGGDLLAARSMHYCLTACGIELDNIDTILRDEILATPAYAQVRSRAQAVDHHACHAATAFFTSGFDRSAVIVVDNAGGQFKDLTGETKLQTTSWYLGDGRSLNLMDRVGSTNWTEGPLFRGKPFQNGDGDHSIGHFYKQLSGALGFRFPRNTKPGDFYFPEDGITMGLASYGAAGEFVDDLTQFVELESDGHYSLRLSDGAMTQCLIRILGEAPDFQRMADVAAAGQEILTRIMCHLVDHAIAETGTTQICLSGGVAMNSATNGEILKRTKATEIHIPFVPGDNGTGLGAVLLDAASDPDSPIPTVSVYGGKSYDDSEVVAALDGLDTSGYSVRRLKESDLIGEMAKHLEQGKIVSHFSGGSETGRRALGHRSMFADPRSYDMRDHINHNVKRREHFRPFAPVVRDQSASRYFDINQSSPYMQIIFDVRPEKASDIAAVTHVDGTARVQTLAPGTFDRLDGLLVEFGNRTGVEVLLNTSFNGPGQPIVETPTEAVRAFEALGIDVLVLEDIMVTRL